MPRKHTVWDASFGQQIDISFTAGEEIARDIEEGEAQAGQSAEDAKRAGQDTRRARIAELLAIPRSDWTTAQFRELLQFTAQEAGAWSFRLAI